MNTPKEYNRFLKEGIRDEQMLADVIFSFNKRAKNVRDKIKEYSENPHYKTEWKISLEEKKDFYYERKEQLIKNLFMAKAKCIHKHTFYRKARICDYEKNYDKITDFFHTNDYFDYERDEYVNFKDYFEKIENYYLYTEIGNRSFHTPINIKDQNYSNLEIVELPEDFYTYGENIKDLLSLQFCNKVYDKFIASKQVG